MIGQLRGRLADKRPSQVMVDVGGVGYLVAVPLSTYAALGELHTDVTLLIHTHVREDALSLYGFLSSREKHFFELLLGASGVGPSLALKILSGMSVEELVPAIRTGDLTLMPERIFNANDGPTDRKSTRLNSSHTVISYAVFCLQTIKSRYQSRSRPLHNPAFRSAESPLTKYGVRRATFCHQHSSRQSLPAPACRVRPVTLSLTQ